MPAAITRNAPSSRLLHRLKSRISIPVHFIAKLRSPIDVTPSHFDNRSSFSLVQWRAIAHSPTSVTKLQPVRLREVMSGFITHISCTITFVTSCPVSKECW